MVAMIQIAAVDHDLMMGQVMVEQVLHRIRQIQPLQFLVNAKLPSIQIKQVHLLLKQA